MKNKKNIISKISMTMNKNPNLKRVIAIALLIIVIAIFGLLLRSRAATPATTLEVTGAVPNTPTGVAETVASTPSTPTNEGTSVTISGTATDDNGDQWTLLVCKTSGTSGTGCTGDTLCSSSSPVASGSPNSCNVSTTGLPENNPWYAYACDATGCSASSSQGSGDSGSPIVVNHRPSFAMFISPTDNPLPAGTFTFQTETADNDTYGSTTDQVALYVCKANDFTGSACGAGGEWCQNTGPGVNLSCDATTMPIQDDEYDAYPFVIDNHGFAASGANQGVNAPATVNNVAPSVTASSIRLLNTDGGNGPLGLTTIDGLTTGFTVKFTATDANGCLNSSSGNEMSEYGYVDFRTGSGNDETCTTDLNNCFNFLPESGDCTIDAGTCSSVSDTSVDITCNTIFASISDATVADSTFESEIWKSAVQVTDDGSNGPSRLDSGVVVTSNAGTEMGQAMVFDVPEATIAYGSLSPSGTSAQKTTTLTNKGNTGIYSEVSGSDMTRVGGGTIPVNKQVYHIASGFSYTDPTAFTLATTPNATSYGDYCAKPTVYGGTPPAFTFTNTTHPTYWRIQVPNNTPAGNYTGSNTIEAIVSAVAHW